MSEVPAAPNSSVLSRVFLKDGRLRPVLRTILIIPAWLVLLIVTSLPVNLIPRPANNHLTHDTVSAVVAFLSILVLAYAWRRYIDRRSIASLGLTVQRPWLGLLVGGAGVGVVMLSAAFILELALGYVHISGFAPVYDGLWLLIVSAPFWLASAALEEVAVRGYMLQNLWEEFGVVPASIITALIFGALHLFNPNSHATPLSTALTVIGIAGYGLLAAWIAVMTRSLWLVTGLHCAWNMCEGPVFGFPVSGLKIQSIVHQTPTSGPEWFTGGAFGPEAGAVILVPLVLGALVMFALQRAGVWAKLPDNREAYALPEK